MALYEEKCYCCICDECKGHYENFQGFTIFCDEYELRGDLCEDDWREVDGKWYCPYCFEKLFDEDEEGNITRKEK